MMHAFMYKFIEMVNGRSILIQEELQCVKVVEFIDVFHLSFGVRHMHYLSFYITFEREDR
jgi:hypothetical protein